MAKKNNGKPAPSTPGPRVDLAEIQRILAFMTAHGLEELDYERGDLHVRLKRQAAPGAAAAGASASAPAPRPLAAGNPGAAGAASLSPAAEPEPSAAGLHTVKSPIVGTFYAAPAPDAPPFVKVGNVVTPGQVLCIVEAMKLMNEIEADQAGEIVRCLVENGQPVEYGQPLFAIRPQAGA
jgi:acetyl-CoA carboxylase biotin carboxyl carrier protein